MSATLTGAPVAYPAGYDPLGRPMSSAYQEGAPLGRPAAYSSGQNEPNWLVIGSIAGVALVLLILVGVIAATSLSGGGTPVAANSQPPANVPPDALAQPTAATAATSTVPTVSAVAPAAANPPTLNSTPSSSQSTSGSPMGTTTVPSSGGPGNNNVPVVGPSSASPGTPVQSPSGQRPTGSSAPQQGSGASGAKQGAANQATKMLRIISRKTKDTLDVPESVAPNPKGFSAALPTWHGDSRAKLVGVLRVGDNARTTHQGHYSWMHNILPFMGHQDIYDKFDLTKPLHDDKNLIPSCQLVPEFLVPGNPKQRWEGYPFDHLALTHFVGMSGIEDARNVVAGKFDRSDPRAGIFGYDRIAAINEITDGTSNTIAVIGIGDLANPWTMGGGSTIRGARQPYFDKLTGFGSHGQKGAITMMADGSVRLISENIDPAVFRAMCTMHGAETVDLPVAAPPFKLD